MFLTVCHKMSRWTKRLYKFSKDRDARLRVDPHFELRQNRYDAFRRTAKRNRLHHQAALENSEFEGSALVGNMRKHMRNPRVLRGYDRKIARDALLSFKRRGFDGLEVNRSSSGGGKRQGGWSGKGAYTYTPTRRFSRVPRVPLKRFRFSSGNRRFKGNSRLKFYQSSRGTNYVPLRRRPQPPPDESRTAEMGLSSADIDDVLSELVMPQEQRLFGRPNPLSGIDENAKKYMSVPDESSMRGALYNIDSSSAVASAIANLEDDSDL